VRECGGRHAPGGGQLRRRRRGPTCQPVAGWPQLLWGRACFACSFACSRLVPPPFLCVLLPPYFFHSRVSTGPRNPGPLCSERSCELWPGGERLRLLRRGSLLPLFCPSPPRTLGLCSLALNFFLFHFICKFLGSGAFIRLGRESRPRAGAYQTLPFPPILCFVAPIKSRAKFGNFAEF
jgi:hypothetical protein